jgi:hypothetical protein
MEELNLDLTSFKQDIEKPEKIQLVEPLPLQFDNSKKSRGKYLRFFFINPQMSLSYNFIKKKLS